MTSQRDSYFWLESFVIVEGCVEVKAYKSLTSAECRKNVPACKFDKRFQIDLVMGRSCFRIRILPFPSKNNHVRNASNCSASMQMQPEVV